MKSKRQLLKPSLPRQRRTIAIAAGVVLLLVGIFAGWKILGDAPISHSPSAQIPGLNLQGVTDVDPEVVRAVDEGRRAVERDPQSPQAWGRLGMLLRANGGSPDAANHCFAQAERLTPNDPKWPYFQAVALQPRDPSAAMQMLKRTVALCGSHPDAPRVRLAELLLAQQQIDLAEEQFKELLSADPSNAAAHLGLSRIAIARRQGKPALTELSAASQDPHTRKSASVLLAQILLRMNRQHDAERMMQESARLPADAPWPDPWLAEVQEAEVGKKAGMTRAARLIAAGRDAEAIDTAQDVLRRYPGSEQALLLEGIGLNAVGRYADAEAALRQAIASNPAAAEPYFHLASALRAQGKLEQAVANYREAVQRKPDYQLAWFSLGQCLAPDHPPDAIAAFRQAIACEPSYADAHRELGKLLAATGNVSEALEHLHNAVRLQPGDLSAAQALSGLEKGISPSATAPSK